MDDIEIIIPAMFNACDLPCWGQIIPGITSEISAKKLLSSFGNVGKKSVSFQYKNQPVVIDLTFKDGVVNSINLPPEITSFVKIKTLLTEHKAPEDIQLVVIPETAGGTSWFTLVLLYPQQGFFAIFSSEGAVNDSRIDVCPENIPPDLYLLQPNTYSLSEMNDIVFLILQQRLISLETLTEITAPKFTEIFLTETKKCLTTNVELP